MLLMVVTIVQYNYSAHTPVIPLLSPVRPVFLALAVRYSVCDIQRVMNGVTRRRERATVCTGAQWPVARGMAVPSRMVEEKSTA